MAKYLTALPTNGHITHWKGSTFGRMSAKALPAPFLAMDATEPNHYTLIPMTMEMIRARNHALKKKLGIKHFHSEAGGLSVADQLKLAQNNQIHPLFTPHPTKFPTFTPRTLSPTKTPTSKPTWYYPTPRSYRVQQNAKYGGYGVHSQSEYPTKRPTQMPTCIQGNDPITGLCLQTGPPTPLPSPAPTLRPTRARERMPWQQASEVDENYSAEKHNNEGTGTDDDVMNVVGDDD